MKGNAIQHYNHQLNVATLNDKFPGLTCGKVIDVVQATRVIESLYYNFEVQSTAHIYVRFSQPREYFFIKENLSLNALIGFLNNEFPLTNCVLRKDLEGKFYNELERPDQRRIQQYGICIYSVYGQDEAATIQFFKEMLG